MTAEDVAEYEMPAREAERMASNSILEKDKAAWLLIAAQWLRMLRVHRGDSPQIDQSRTTGSGSSASN